MLQTSEYIGLTDLSRGTLGDAHRLSGAKTHRATSASGAQCDPHLDGTAYKFHFGNQLSTSVVDLVSGVRTSETLAPAGRMLTVFLRGGPCSYSVDDGPAYSVAAGQSIFHASSRECLIKAEVEPESAYRFVSIGFDESWVRHRSVFSGPADDPLLRLMDRGDNQPEASFITNGADIINLAEDLYAMRNLGACGLLLAEARVLEIVVKIAGVLGQLDGGPHNSDGALSPGDVERLHEVKRIIDAEFESPLTLSLLARRSGLNVTKLKAGFKHVFGDTVAQYAAGKRLAFAYDLLADTHCAVSTAAYRIGYTPAAFSHAFRQRYGFQPSKIKTRA